MKTPFWSIAIAGFCLASPALAQSQTSYTVDRVVITGSKTVPKETLLAALKSQAGAHVTQADVQEDQTTIHDMLAKAHVVGSVKTRMSTKAKHMTITFLIDDQGAQQAVVTKVSPKFDRQVFAGNVVVPTSDLEAATALKAGEDLTQARLQAAQLAITDAYKKANKVNVSVEAGIKQSPEGKVEIDWKITETAGPKKKKKENEGAGFHLDQDQ